MPTLVQDIVAKMRPQIQEEPRVGWKGRDSINVAKARINDKKCRKHKSQGVSCSEVTNAVELRRCIRFAENCIVSGDISGSELDEEDLKIQAALMDAQTRLNTASNSSVEDFTLSPSESTHYEPGQRPKFHINTHLEPVTPVLPIEKLTPISCSAQLSSMPDNDKPILETGHKASYPTDYHLPPTPITPTSGRNSSFSFLRWAWPGAQKTDATNGTQALHGEFTPPLTPATTRESIHSFSWRGDSVCEESEDSQGSLSDYDDLEAEPMVEVSIKEVVVEGASVRDEVTVEKSNDPVRSASISTEEDDEVYITSRSPSGAIGPEHVHPRPMDLSSAGVETRDFANGRGRLIKRAAIDTKRGKRRDKASSLAKIISARKAFEESLECSDDSLELESAECTCDCDTPMMSGAILSESTAFTPEPGLLFEEPGSISDEPGQFEYLEQMEDKRRPGIDAARKSEPKVRFVELQSDSKQPRPSLSHVRKIPRTSSKFKGQNESNVERRWSEHDSEVDGGDELSTEDEDGFSDEDTGFDERHERERVEQLSQFSQFQGQTEELDSDEEDPGSLRKKTPSSCSRANKLSPAMENRMSLKKSRRLSTDNNTRRPESTGQLSAIPELESRPTIKPLRRAPALESVESWGGEIEPPMAVKLGLFRRCAGFFQGHKSETPSAPIRRLSIEPKSTIAEPVVSGGTARDISGHLSVPSHIPREDKISSISPQPPLSPRSPSEPWQLRQVLNPVLGPADSPGPSILSSPPHFRSFRHSFSACNSPSLSTNSSRAGALSKPAGSKWYSPAHLYSYIVRPPPYLSQAHAGLSPQSMRDIQVAQWDGRGILATANDSTGTGAPVDVWEVIKGRWVLWKQSRRAKGPAGLEPQSKRFGEDRGRTMERKGRGRPRVRPSRQMISPSHTSAPAIPCLSDLTESSPTPRARDVKFFISHPRHRSWTAKLWSEWFVGSNGKARNRLRKRRVALLVSQIQRAEQEAMRNTALSAREIRQELRACMARTGDCESTGCGELVCENVEENEASHEDCGDIEADGETDDNFDQGVSHRELWNGADDVSATLSLLVPTNEVEIPPSPSWCEFFTGRSDPFEQLSSNCGDTTGNEEDDETIDHDNDEGSTGKPIEGGSNSSAEFLADVQGLGRDGVLKEAYRRAEERTSSTDDIELSNSKVKVSCIRGSGIDMKVVESRTSFETPGAQSPSELAGCAYASPFSIPTISVDHVEDQLEDKKRAAVEVVCRSESSSSGDY